VTVFLLTVTFSCLSYFTGSKTPWQNMRASL